MIVLRQWNKYKVAPKEERTLDGILFASKGEMERYAELKLLERAGEIEDLELQPSFDIDLRGKFICKYVADFRYKEKGQIVVEDFKGMETPEFKLKWKLIKARLPHYIWRKTHK